ncbi:uncharacterized protein CANTADRAFT_26504 [Suhomyces tanzawaensis NRRL Y-17324]|uniref:Chromatin assembly factor 1 subunit A n=1 Tax=Suhomyces tanzawaensis NRRL Y-17324 TaxID=984487 RepID=A0A1E4SFU3_9ASCO|nr:uncharacterized protein CANTADRAFT_26504 [Suhomyces tanzawaensis NRRL Y-17324]ODV78377.1 hypothetical protein CANTADRAFT_26504 [Suhomyces tanzawaensis NRRL Y-17324]
MDQTVMIVEEDTPEKRKSPDAQDEESPNKKHKVEEVLDSPKLTKKELNRIEKQRQRELEKIEKEKQKEADRLEKEKQKELERQEKERKKEEDRLEREKRKEEEKKAKELERELKRKKLVEEKLEREKKKEEEKEKKQAEREKLKLEKKRKLEEEKERKEASKKKAEEEKQRSQMKISSFFQVGPKKEATSSPTKTKSDDNVSEYDKEFLPFFVQKNVLMPPSGQLTAVELQQSKEKFDQLLSQNQEAPILPIEITNQSSQLKPYSSVTPIEIVTALNLSNTTESQIYEMLQQIPPLKYISFYENSKPPYIGTWCSEKHQKIKIPVSNPIDTSLTGLDYEYDSDLEWDKEDDEGEDLENDEDEEDDEMMNEDDDIDDFVENNQEGTVSRKFHSLVIVNKWNDGTNNEFFDQFTTSLCAEVTIPLNPSTEPAKELELRSETTTLVPQASAIPTNVLTPQKKTIKDAKVIAGLIEFVEKNQDFTIGTLVELSKKEFKDFTKALLKNTIQDIAVYNKKNSIWDIKSEVKEKYQAHIDQSTNESSGQEANDPIQV